MGWLCGGPEFVIDEVQITHLSLVSICVVFCFFAVVIEDFLKVGHFFLALFGWADCAVPVSVSRGIHELLKSVIFEAVNRHLAGDVCFFVALETFQILELDHVLESGVGTRVLFLSLDFDVRPDLFEESMLSIGLIRADQPQTGRFRAANRVAKLHFFGLPRELVYVRLIFLDGIGRRFVLGDSTVADGHLSFVRIVRFLRFRATVIASHLLEHWRSQDLHRRFNRPDIEIEPSCEGILFGPSPT